MDVSVLRLFHQTAMCLQLTEVVDDTERPTAVYDIWQKTKPKAQ